MLQENNISLLQGDLSFKKTKEKEDYPDQAIFFYVLYKVNLKKYKRIN